jgi:hypothetical protein
LVAAHAAAPVEVMYFLLWPEPHVAILLLAFVWSGQSPVDSYSIAMLVFWVFFFFLAPFARSQVIYLLIGVPVPAIVSLSLGAQILHTHSSP